MSNDQPFTNKKESLKWAVHPAKCDQLEKKRNMESTVWKFTMESIVHSILKQHGNYNMSLLIPESTLLPDTITRRDLHVFALLYLIL